MRTLLGRPLLLLLLLLVVVLLARLLMVLVVVMVRVMVMVLVMVLPLCSESHLWILVDVRGSQVGGCRLVRCKISHHWVLLALVAPGVRRPLHPV